MQTAMVGSYNHMLPGVQKIGAAFSAVVAHTIELGLNLPLLVDCVTSGGLRGTDLATSSHFENHTCHGIHWIMGACIQYILVYA